MAPARDWRVDREGDREEEVMGCGDIQEEMQQEKLVPEDRRTKTEKRKGSRTHKVSRLRP
jgi:hypothetical protein